MRLMRILLRPLGYLVFVVALAALSASARILGEEHPLGFFAARLAHPIWRYPEVTRRGVLVAWLVWAALFGIAISPHDPLHTRWDEVALGAQALIMLGRQRAASSRDDC